MATKKLKNTKTTDMYTWDIKRLKILRVSEPVGKILKNKSARDSKIVSQVEAK